MVLESQGAREGDCFAGVEYTRGGERNAELSFNGLLRFWTASASPTTSSRGRDELTVVRGTSNNNNQNDNKRKRENAKYELQNAKRRRQKREKKKYAETGLDRRRAKGAGKKYIKRKKTEEKKSPLPAPCLVFAPFLTGPRKPRAAAPAHALDPGPVGGFASGAESLLYLGQ